jgi:hypothetical protein
VRVTWSHVDLVERNGDIVILHIGQTRIPLPAGGFSGLRGGQRGAEQLTRALRYARDRAMTQPGSEYDVPRVVSARPSLLFPVVFVVYVPLLAWLLQVTADAM